MTGILCQIGLLHKFDLVKFHSTRSRPPSQTSECFIPISERWHSRPLTGSVSSCSHTGYLASNEARMKKNLYEILRKHCVIVEGLSIPATDMKEKYIIFG